MKFRITEDGYNMGVHGMIEELLENKPIRDRLKRNGLVHIMDYKK